MTPKTSVCSDGFPVEVRKNPQATTWYDAHLLDLVGSHAVVTFGGIWPDREVPCAGVRRVSQRSGQGDAQQKLGVGDPVDVRVASSGRNPSGWSFSRVEAVENGFLQVRVDSKLLFLSSSVVRPASREPTLDPLSMLRQVVWIDQVLQNWLAMSDAAGCIEQVRLQSGLELAGAGSGAKGIGYSCTEGIKHFDAVILIGAEQACRRGEMFLKIHTMHQREVEKFHERRCRKMKILQEKMQMPALSGVHAAFDVPVDLVGRTAGKGGERAQRIEKEHGVEIRIIDGADDSSPCHIRITGEKQEAVDRAREDLELIRHNYVVEGDRVGWVLGKGYRDIQDIAQKSQLAFTRWTGEALELVGTRSCVDDALMLLENHNEYFHIYQEMSLQTEEIDQSFEALDEAAVSVGLAPPTAYRRSRSRSSGPPTAKTERPRSKGRVAAKETSPRSPKRPTSAEASGDETAGQPEATISKGRAKQRDRSRGRKVASDSPNTGESLDRSVGAEPQKAAKSSVTGTTAPVGAKAVERAVTDIADSDVQDTSTVAASSAAVSERTRRVRVGRGRGGSGTKKVGASEDSEPKESNGDVADGAGSGRVRRVVRKEAATAADQVSGGYPAGNVGRGGPKGETADSGGTGGARRSVKGATTAVADQSNGGGPGDNDGSGLARGDVADGGGSGGGRRSARGGVAGGNVGRGDVADGGGSGGVRRSARGGITADADQASGGESGGNVSRGGTRGTQSDEAKGRNVTKTKKST
eukprot:TRINITY_DN62355_c0_g1_i1.p1 TRINITY_DN62355_c0_g1~~TRINITY_DN62355_c0_g1_i1.p1  ORF type:complete len:753 (+),score=132.59 TRINITY_DN62355_c0_g1_i1:65-2323(+)